MDQQNMFEDEQEKIQFKKRLDQRNSTVRKMYHPKTSKQINGCQLELDFVFGINQRQIANQLMMIGESQVVFMVSNMVVIRDINSKQQIFIFKDGRFKHATALFAVKKKEKVIVAVVESTVDDQNCTIVVTKTVKQKWHVLNVNAKGNAKQALLDVERKSVGALIVNQLNTILTIWNYKKERLLAQVLIKTPIDKFTFHPQKQRHLLLQGQSYLKVWEMHVQEKIMKENHDQLVPLKIEKESKFLDHTWINTNPVQTLIILASNNRILLIQGDQLKKIIDIDVQNLNIVDAVLKDVNSPEENDDLYGLNTVLEDIIRDKPQNQLGQNQHPEERKMNVNSQQGLEFFSIASMSNTKKGFILGGNKGCLCFYEFEKNLSIVNTLSFQMKSQTQGMDHKIVFLSNSLNDAIITIVSSTKQNNEINYHILNTYQLDTEVSPIQPFFSAGFHNKKINDISIAITKQIFVTCSEDNTVKVWNYFESENIEKRGLISQYFKEEPFSVSVHPLGMFLAVGFSNGFKIFAILSESFYPLKEVGLNNCKILKYSNGGHYLVANEKSNVIIYDSIYYEAIQVLDGHTALIKDIAISDNDLFVVSTCMNGYVFCWNIQQTSENILKAFEHQENSIYNSIQYEKKMSKSENQDSDIFVGCTNEKYLVLYRNRCKELIAEFEIQDCTVNKLIISSQLKCLFMGTNKGAVRIILWPLEDVNLEMEMINPNSNQVKFKHPEYYELQVHSAPITSMALSWDGQYLITGAEDGSIFMMRVKDKNIEDNSNAVDPKKQQQINQKGEEKLRTALIQNDLFLDKIIKIQEKNDTISRLNFEVIKSEQTVRIETQKLEAVFKQKIEQINREHIQTLENDRKMKDTFVQKSEEEYNKLLQQYKTEKSQYDQEIENLKKNHQEKIEFEEQRNKELLNQIDEVKDHHKQDLMKMLIQHKEDLKKLKQNFFEKCQKVQVKYSNVVDNAKNFGNAFIQRLEKQDAQYEKEIDESIKELKDQIAKVKSTNTTLESQNTKLIKEYENLKKEDEDLQIKFEQLFKQHNQIRHMNLKNDEDILKMQHQLLERLQVIDSKEETCKAAKDEQINLENFRYMLDQKIKSLQNDKEVLLNKINDKEKNLKSMFNELIKESNQNEEKYQELKKLQMDIKVLENQIKKAEVEIFFNNNKLNTYENTLQQLLKSNDQPAVIAQKLHEMITHCEDEQEMKKYMQKSNITNSDIKDMVKLKQERANEVNDELLRQGKWMTKKLYLIKLTSDKLKDIREDNINTILSQNTKLIEECNLLRSENEKYKKEIKNVEKLLSDAIRKRQKLKQQQQAQDPEKYNQLEKKMEENQKKLAKQKFKLESINEQVNDIISNKNEKNDKNEEKKKKHNPNIAVVVEDQQEEEEKEKIVN